MNIIPPTTVTDAILRSSNIAEDDHPEWDSAATYNTGDSVIVLATHRVYTSLSDGNANNNPTTDRTNWIDAGATNRWRAFDNITSDAATNSGSITYTLAPQTLVNAIALFGLRGSDVNIVIRNGNGEETFNRTIDLVDGTLVTNWLEYFTLPIIFATEAVLVDVYAISGYEIEITISSGAGVVAVGEIVFGQSTNLGETLDGTSLGIEDFSVTDNDSFGNRILVERASYSEVTYQFTADKTKGRSIQRAVDNARAKGSVWYSNDPSPDLGTLIFGFPRDFNAPLSAGGQSVFQLQIRGL